MCIDHGRFAGDIDDDRNVRHLQSEVHCGGTADLQHDILALGGGEALCGDGHSVGHRRQFQELIHPLVIALRASGKARSGIVEGDGGAGNDAPFASEMGAVQRGRGRLCEGHYRSKQAEWTNRTRIP